MQSYRPDIPYPRRLRALSSSALACPRFYFHHSFRALAALLLILTVSSGARAASYLDTMGMVHDPILSRSGAAHPYEGPNLEPGLRLIDYFGTSGLSLANANLRRASLHLAILGYLDFSSADLTEADLSNARLSAVSFGSAILVGANLANSAVSDVVFSDADLTHANLSGAGGDSVVISNGNFTGANMTEMGLQGAVVYGANFAHADLSNSALDATNLTGVNLSNTILFNTNLRGVVGLDRTIGIPMYDAETNFDDTGFDPVAAGWIFVPEPSAGVLVGLGLMLLRSSVIRRRG